MHTPQNTTTQINLTSPQSLLTWIHSFPYPNCHKAHTLSDLKTGIAVAQILTEILPEEYQKRLLAGVEIGKMGVETAVANWGVVRDGIGKWVRERGIPGIRLGEYTGEGLYYREQELVKFISEVLYKLYQLKQKASHTTQPQPSKTKNPSYSNTIMAHLLEEQEQQQYQQQVHTFTRTGPNFRKENSYMNVNSNVNLSQLSDIANTSYPDMLLADGKIVNVNPYHNNNRNHNNDTDEQQKEQIVYRPQQQPIPEPELSLLQTYITQKLSIPTSDFHQPHQILGHLVNKIFCSSRLNNYIIKQAHFIHGALFVYRRVLEFLINDPRVEKIGKRNVLEMMRGIEEEGVVREMGFWRVVRDLRNFQMDRARGNSVNRSRRLSTKQKKSNKNAQKQNNNPNHPQLARKASTRTLSKCKTSKNILTLEPNFHPNSYLSYKYTQSSISQAQHWLSKDLGLQHTVSKIYSQNSILANSLLNGFLVGSLLMRIKIGKVGIGRACGTMAELKSNWDGINRMCGLRGYEAFRGVPAILWALPANPNTKELVNIFMDILNRFRLEYSKKCPQSQTSSHSPYTSTSNPCNNCPPDHQTLEKPSPSPSSLWSQKHSLTGWLSQTFSVSVSASQPLTVSLLTQTCKELLNISIYKETTKKIQENNVEKILAQMRTIGLSEYYGIRREDVMGDQGVRWKILGDLRWVIQGKIVFCRA